MNINLVIKDAIVTEKISRQNSEGVYAFLVDKRAGKKDIAHAVSKAFSVKVKSVNVIKVASKVKRIGSSRKFAVVGGGKKAIVKLVKGQTINLLAPKTEKATKKEKEKKEIKS